MKYVTFEIEGQRYDVAPCFEAASLIEHYTGKSFPRAVSQAMQMHLTTIRDIINAALKSAGENVSSDTVQACLFADMQSGKEGLTTKALEYVALFFPALDDDEGEKKPLASATS